MDFSTLTLLFIVCCSIYYYFKKKLSYFEEMGLPYVPAWPILGNFAPAVMRQKQIAEVIRDIYNCNREAKYVGAFDFVQPVYVLRDPELIKSVTIKNFDSFSDHRAVVDSESEPLFAANLLNMTGEKWKEARNLLSPAFTSSKMKGMFELMVVVATNFVNHMESLKDEDRKMINTKDLFTKFTNDTIATCAFGINVDSLKDPTNKFYVLGKEATTFGAIKTLKFFIARLNPSILKFFNVRFFPDEIVNFFTSVVSSTVATRDEKGISRPDMIQLMMDARGKESKHLKLDTLEMTGQAFIFFFGGFDSSSTEMCWMAHELAINPDIQKKLQEEIDDALRNTNGKPTYESIINMRYLDAVFNETMRYHTHNSFLTRLCTKRFELPPALPGLKPIIIEPNTDIWIPSSAIHRDPQYYENPDTFDPDRYYHKKVTINDVTNLGFGIGPRACIGNRFTILETKILFFYLLSKFTLKAHAKTCNPVRYSKSAFIIQPEGGFWLLVEPRN